MKKLFKFLSLALASMSLLLSSASAVKPIDEYMADERGSGKTSGQLIDEYVKEICERHRCIMIQLSDKYLSRYDINERLVIKHNLLLELKNLRKTVIYDLKYFGTFEGDIKSRSDTYLRTISEDAVRFMFGLMESFNNGEYRKNLDDPRAKEIMDEAQRKGYVETEIYVTVVSGAPGPMLPSGKALLVENGNIGCRRFRYLMF